MRWRRTGIRIKLPRCSLSLLTQRGFFRQFECTEMKFFHQVTVYRVTVYRCRRRRFDERKYGIREPLPDSEIIRRNREPPEPEHVTSRLGYMADLVPIDLTDRQSLLPFGGHNRDRSTG